MSFLFINKTLPLNNLKIGTSMNTKISATAIIHLPLYNLHDCTFIVQGKVYINNIMETLDNNEYWLLSKKENFLSKNDQCLVLFQVLILCNTTSFIITQICLILIASLFNNSYNLWSIIKNVAPQVSVVGLIPTYFCVT